MSRVALSAAFAGGLAWLAARVATMQLADEESGRGDWANASGDLAWVGPRAVPQAAPVVVELPDPRADRVYSAA